jgi:hypothetical protein
MQSRPIAVLRYTWKDEPNYHPDFQDAEFQALFLEMSLWWSLPKYWFDCTFGLFDFAEGSRLFPWAVHPLDHGLWVDPANPQQGVVCRHERKEVAVKALAHAQLEHDLSSFRSAVIFMAPPPAPAGSLQAGRGPDGVGNSVLDWNQVHAYYAHELGHCLGLGHSFGSQFDGVYGDPYCIMSARTFGGMNPTFRMDPEPTPHMPTNVHESCGPMIAAATLFTFVPEFEASGMVLHVDPADFEQPFTINALSRASLGDPVLGVFERDGRKWTLEYRIAEKWDRGLVGNSNSPGPAVVIHAIQETMDGIRPCYMGRIRVPFVDDIRDWQAPWPFDIGVWVDEVRDGSVVVRFTPKRERSVYLQVGDVDNLSLFSQHFPPRPHEILSGLCPAQEFESTSTTRSQRLTFSAKTTGYARGAFFDWSVNGVLVPQSPDSGSLVVPVRADYGHGETPVDAQATIAYRQDGNDLQLENVPSDGNFLVDVGVRVAEQLSSSVSQASGRFEGTTHVVHGLHEAEQECSALVNFHFFVKHAGQFFPLPGKFLRALDESRGLSAQDRQTTIELASMSLQLRDTEPDRAHELARAASTLGHIPIEDIERP